MITVVPTISLVPILRMYSLLHMYRVWIQSTFTLWYARNCVCKTRLSGKRDWKLTHKDTGIILMP